MWSFGALINLLTGPQKGLGVETDASAALSSRKAYQVGFFKKGGLKGGPKGELKAGA